jgi:serine/threonine-protein phosphatase 6 regulatory ankyrin repeat subunit B
MSMNSDALNRTLWNTCANALRLPGDQNVRRAMPLIAGGGDVNFVNASQQDTCCLAIAAFKGLHAIVALLLRSGATVDAKTSLGFTALTLAAQYGHNKCVELLLQASAATNIHAQGMHGSPRGPTALMLAAGNGHDKCVEMLLTAGAEKDAEGGGGFTALLFAAQNGRHKCVKLLLLARADTEAKQIIEGGTALVMAAQEGHDKCIELLINAAADLEAQTSRNLTALIIAAQHGSATCISLLTNAGADKEAKTIIGSTALIMAAQHGRTKCVQRLLTAGADKEVRTYEGNTALLVAASKGHHDCIKVLLGIGCDINAIGANGASALVWAVHGDYLDCARTLVRAGADVSVTFKGRSLDYYAYKCKTDVDALKVALRLPVSKMRQCAHCGMASWEKMSKCSGCKTVSYCNRACQVAHWKVHKQACKPAVKEHA